MTNLDRERKVDIKTIQAMEDVKAGRHEPIGDLLEMIEEDKNAYVGRGRDEIHSGQGEIADEADGFSESAGKEITEHDQWFRRQVEEALENADGSESHFESHEQVRSRWAKRREKINRDLDKEGLA